MPISISGSGGISGLNSIDSPTFVVDETNNRIGVGTANPSRTLDVIGDSKLSGVVSLPQNPTGTTYGSGASAIPTYYIAQDFGDNDIWKIYGESSAINTGRMVFEVGDDNDESFLFRHKRNYGAYDATESLAISPTVFTYKGSKIWYADNILGTVSQSSGVPTGALIESGSNTNGQYVRYANGTQICTRIYTTGTVVSGGDGVGWTYPAAFSALPAVTNLGGFAYADYYSYSAQSVTTTGVTCYYRPIPNTSAASGVGQPMHLGNIAIGRWF